MKPNRIMWFAVGALLLCLQLSTAFAYRWKNVVIGGGGYVPAIIYSKAEPGLAYARTDVGGAYRWNPLDKTWIPLTDGFNDWNDLAVAGLACDPKDADRVYIVAGFSTQARWEKKGAFFRSDDRGSTWKRYGLPFKIGGHDPGRGDGEKLQVDPHDGNTLYLATTANGLWKSIDRGATWRHLSSFPGTRCTFVILDEASGTIKNRTRDIYVGTIDHLPDRLAGGIYKSGDAGASWALLAGQPTQLRPKSYGPAHIPLPPCALKGVIGGDNLFFAFSNGPSPHGDHLIENNITNGAVYRFNKLTGTWTEITPNIELQGGYCAIDIHPENPDIIFAGSIGREWPQDDIHYSLNAGATWNTLMLDISVWPHAPKATFNTFNSPYAKKMLPHWMTAFAINPLAPDEAMFGTGYGIFRSTNLSQTLSGKSSHWVFESKGLEETTPRSVISPPTGVQVVSAMEDIDGFRHDNPENSPLQGAHQPSGGTSVSIAVAWKSPDVIVRSHNSGSTYASISWNGGDSWYFFPSQPKGATGGGAIAISANASSIVWAPYKIKAHYSLNKGDSWAPSKGIPEEATPVGDPNNDRIFYAYDKTRGVLYRSIDRGAHFIAVKRGLPVLGIWQEGGELLCIPDQPGHIWLALGVNGLYCSIDGGVDFKAINGVGSAFLAGSGKAAEGARYPALFIHGKINDVEGLYRSDDLGATWKKINNARQEWGRHYTCLSGDPNRFGRVYVGTGGRGLFYGDEDDDESKTVIAATSVQVAPRQALLHVDENLQLTATINPFNASNQVVIWESNNPSVAQVDATGLVIGKANGTAVISATTRDGGFKATGSVTVKSPGVGLNIQKNNGIDAKVKPENREDDAPQTDTATDSKVDASVDRDMESTSDRWKLSVGP